MKPELVHLLYAGTFNVVFISCAAAGFCSLLSYHHNDPVFALFAVLAMAIGGVRLAIDIAYRRAGDRHPTKSWEIWHGLGSFAFSAVVGAIGAYAFQSSQQSDVQLFAVTFLISYCTGVLTRLAVRPKIAIGCTAVAAAPYIVALLLQPSLLLNLLGLFILIMWIAGLQLIETTHRLTLEMLLTKSEMAALAGTDALTGLGNRFTLDQKLRRLLLDGSVTPEAMVAVHFIDLDHFKAANDTHGHAVGDAILVEVGRRLTALLPPNAFAARRGGDEFLLVQPSVTDPHTAYDLARRITDNISAPYIVDNLTVVIGASVGISMTGDTAITAHSLIVSADQALYDAKRNGRGSVEMRDPHLDLVA
ncbi:GGDEF domain-containing protein [Rhizobium oryzicola]|uniref:GGDEF domain-containing protein n=1 Tax=Rhizobium oryzicola TaxID=1232668 RepID=A0ABT8T3H5_9HYPH|nr:GGDEF domain-containing protein [Rhizobium oryzicola]MDO1585136.1 GGDEF domain-containing protein [Rhizobium oryzicola]